MPNLRRQPLTLAISIMAVFVLPPPEARAGIENGVPVEQLAAPVRIELDAHAMPSIAATAQDDAMAGLGFMHARDRMMQMDLSRRKAA